VLYGKLKGMEAYINIVKKVLRDGVLKDNRTGVATLSYPGLLFEHDMSKGFPLLTTKKIPFRLITSELEFFIKGLTDKRWLQARNNHIWDEWSGADFAPYGTDAASRNKMRVERDLGPIYGWQWRHFGASYKNYDTPVKVGIDQLKQVIDTLKNNPDDRRMIISAWNPADISRMALPPCHYAFQLTVTAGNLNLLWNQRSVDVALGLPFNIASYATLLHLLAKEAGLGEGRLIGFLGDTHIYINHVDNLKEQIARAVRELPVIRTEDFTTIFAWEYTASTVENYNPHPSIKFEIAV
jgi:thymidylate synthase